MLRINKAKNFKGKAYVAADELDNLVKSMTFANTGSAITHATGNADNDWVINFTNLDGTPATTSAVDLTKIKDYIDNKSITVTGGNGIAINDTNKLNPTISADIDGTTIAFTGSTDGSKVLSTALTLKKKGTANTGFAASYQLVDANGTAISGSDDIDLIKDQFLKGVVLGYGTYTDSTTAPNDWTTTKTGTLHAILKLTFALTKTEASAQTAGTADDTDSDIYIDVNGLFDAYEAGNSAINATELAANKITVVVDGTNKIYTSANDAGQSILTIGNNGIEVAKVQQAINYAVADEHAKASAAIAGVNTNVTNLANTTSTAVGALNTRIETVATSAQTAISNASANLNTKIDSAVANAQTAIQSVGAAVDTLDNNVSAAVSDINTKVETAVDTVISNVNTALGTNITAVNNAVSAAVVTVNTKVDSAVTNVNTAVTNLKNTVSTTIDNINTNIGNFETSVETAITSVNTNVTNLKNTVSTTFGTVKTYVDSAIANRTTQLTNVLQVNESAVTPVPGTSNTSECWYSATVSAKYVIAVYGSDDIEIYPEIARTGTSAFTLSADYGSAQQTVEQWKVVCANALPALTAAGNYSNTVAYTSANTAVTYTAPDNDVAYSDADKGTNASYTNATKTNATAVDVADGEFTGVAEQATTAITAPGAGTATTTVGNGNAATPPTAPTASQEGDLSYTGNNQNN